MICCALDLLRHIGPIPSRDGLYLKDRDWGQAIFHLDRAT